MINRRYMWTYAVILLFASALAAWTILPRFYAGEIPVLVVLFALTVLLGNMAVELPFAVSMSLAFSSVCAGVFYSGPWGGFLLGLAASISLQEIRERKPLVLVLVNVSQLSLAGLLSGWVYALLGRPLVHGVGVPASWSGAVLALAAAVVVSYVVNLLLVGVALSIKAGMRARAVIEVLNPSAYLLSMIILALLGYVMAYLITVGSWLGLLLLVLPFAMARRTFRVYIELSEAYTSTVRSLVAAIEAKDPYTMGHSERVAQYARMVAERMELSRAEVDLLERAALLHDVGKIGVSLNTLMSPDQLSDEEVQAIRRHPALGANLVADVEFLRDTVEIIQCHHERCDGEGYPGGVTGDRIPPLARILAVADAYDAMTSDRAYRPGMSSAAACRELSRVSGTQLDPVVVRSFADAISDALAGTAIA